MCIRDSLISIFVFRCTSISCFQVVTKWLSDFFSGSSVCIVSTVSTVSTVLQSPSLGRLSLHWYTCFSNLLHLLNQGKCHHRRNPAIHLAWKHFVFRLDVSTDSLNNSPMILLYLSRTQCRWNIAIIYPILSHVPFLAVHNSSIGDLVPWLVCWSGTTNNQSLHNTTEWS